MIEATAVLILYAALFLAVAVWHFASVEENRSRLRDMCKILDALFSNPTDQGDSTSN